MNQPKPHPYPRPSSVGDDSSLSGPLPVGVDTPISPSLKKPFVLTPHLTTRPLSNNSELAALKKRLYSK